MMAPWIWIKSITIISLAQLLSGMASMTQLLVLFHRNVPPVVRGDVLRIEMFEFLMLAVAPSPQHTEAVCLLLGL